MSASSTSSQGSENFSSDKLSNNYCGYTEEKGGDIRERNSDEERETQLRQNLNTINGVALLSGNYDFARAQVSGYTPMSQSQRSQSTRQGIIEGNNAPAGSGRANPQCASNYASARTESHGCIPLSQSHSTESAQQESHNGINPPAGRVNSQCAFFNNITIFPRTHPPDSSSDAAFNEAKRRQILQYERLHRAHIHLKTSRPNPSGATDTVRSQPMPVLTDSSGIPTHATSGNAPPSISISDTNSYSRALQAQIREYDRLQHLHQARTRCSLSQVDQNNIRQSSESSSPLSQPARSLRTLGDVSIMDHSSASDGSAKVKRSNQAPDLRKN